MEVQEVAEEVSEAVEVAEAVSRGVRQRLSLTCIIL